MIQSRRCDPLLAILRMMNDIMYNTYNLLGIVSETLPNIGIDRHALLSHRSSSVSTFEALEYGDECDIYPESTASGLWHRVFRPASVNGYASLREQSNGTSSIGKL